MVVASSSRGPGSVVEQDGKTKPESHPITGGFGHALQLKLRTTWSSKRKSLLSRVAEVNFGDASADADSNRAGGEVGRANLPIRRHDRDGRHSVARRPRLLDGYFCTHRVITAGGAGTWHYANCQATSGEGKQRVR